MTTTSSEYWNGAGMMSGAADSNSNSNGRASDEQILGSADSSSSWIPTGAFPNNNEDGKIHLYLCSLLLVSKNVFRDSLQFNNRSYS